MYTTTTTRPLILVEATCFTCGHTHSRADELMYEQLDDFRTWRFLTLRLWHQELYADLRVCAEVIPGWRERNYHALARALGLADEHGHGEDPLLYTRNRKGNR